MAKPQVPQTMSLFEMETPRAEAKEAEQTAKPARTPGWFPRNSTDLLNRGYEFLGDGRCKQKQCNAPITFWRTPTGKTIPIDYMPTMVHPATLHFKTCKNPMHKGGKSEK
jgi:hypothetical protein